MYKGFHNSLLRVCLSEKDIVNEDFHEYFKNKDIFMLSYRVLHIGFVR